MPRQLKMLGKNGGHFNGKPFTPHSILTFEDAKDENGNPDAEAQAELNAKLDRLVALGMAKEVTPKVG